MPRPTPNDYRLNAETISRVLDEKALTQRQLAEDLGCSASFLSDLVRGHRALSRRMRRSILDSAHFAGVAEDALWTKTPHEAKNTGRSATSAAATSKLLDAYRAYSTALETRDAIDSTTNWEEYVRADAACQTTRAAWGGLFIQTLLPLLPGMFDGDVCRLTPSGVDIKPAADNPDHLLIWHDIETSMGARNTPARLIWCLRYQTHTAGPGMLQSVDLVGPDLARLVTSLRQRAPWAESASAPSWEDLFPILVDAP